MQSKKVKVLKLVSMDLFNKIEDIIMMSLSILFNTNPMPLLIYTPLPLKEPEQQRSNVKEKL